MDETETDIIKNAAVEVFGDGVPVSVTGLTAGKKLQS